MAIISAGVIMNVIFAFLMAVVAFGLGVQQLPCVVGEVFPGGPAWQADLQPGDRILKIAGKKMKQFRDLQTAIMLGDIDKKKGVEIEVKRPGVEKPFVLTVKPDNSLGAFFIGVAPGRTTRLLENRDTWIARDRPPVMPGSAADRTRLAFRNGDEIVRIDDVPISNYGQINTGIGAEGGQEDHRGRPPRRAGRQGQADGQDRGNPDHGRSQSDAAAGPGHEDGRGHGDPGRIARGGRRHPARRRHRQTGRSIR